MNHPKLSSLDDSLRQEAHDIREPFSPTLHARIQQQIHNHAIKAPRFNFLRLMQAVPLIVLLGALVWIWIEREPVMQFVNTPPKAPKIAQGDLKALQGLVNSPATPMAKFDQTVNTLAFAGLDQDAKSLTKFLGRQLDAFPTSAR